ncbi:uncharacterized protein LOC111395066 [Olea europaea var. sylvestris]|uniref:uncharacterized protein LOC111395066 n=1 Tax=Olea europaea var. sylvestris TaxID=158386 RepID=UPI000C1D859C|nr:uncharacterized protein LOC111395066 [Olea europaea var. sylvestris]
MQVLNLIRDFELQRVKESEFIEDYTNRLLSIANRVRLLGYELTNSSIIEKILLTLTERFEATIITLKNTKDMSKITLAESLNVLQAQEQQRIMREDGIAEGALPAKHNDYAKNKKNQPTNGENTTNSYNKGRKLEGKLSSMQALCHEVVICKSKNQQQETEAQVVGEEEEDQLFVATCFSSGELREYWLIDNGCTNHMTHNRELFVDLKPANTSKVKIGNRDHIAVKG